MNKISIRFIKYKIIYRDERTNERTSDNDYNYVYFGQSMMLQ